MVPRSNGSGRLTKLSIFGWRRQHNQVLAQIFLHGQGRSGDLCLQKLLSGSALLCEPGAAPPVYSAARRVAAGVDYNRLMMILAISGRAVRRQPRRSKISVIRRARLRTVGADPRSRWRSLAPVGDARGGAGRRRAHPLRRGARCSGQAAARESVAGPRLVPAGGNWRKYYRPRGDAGHIHFKTLRAAGNPEVFVCHPTVSLIAAGLLLLLRRTGACRRPAATGCSCSGSGLAPLPPAARRADRPGFPRSALRRASALLRGRGITAQANGMVSLIIPPAQRPSGSGGGGDLLDLAYH